MNKTCWLVPKKLIMQFTRRVSHTDWHFKDIIKHDDEHYLVTVEGSYPFLENQLLHDYPELVELNT